MPISIHKALAGLDLRKRRGKEVAVDFNPQGPRGPRHRWGCLPRRNTPFQSTRPSRASTPFLGRQGGLNIFQSTRPSRASTYVCGIHRPEAYRFQSTRPSRASTRGSIWKCHLRCISIHKALAGLDCPTPRALPHLWNFNPQGPRGPRRSFVSISFSSFLISIHKALAGLDGLL